MNNSTSRLSYFTDGAIKAEQPTHGEMIAIGACLSRKHV
jgi:hypothetical protein